MPKKIPTPGESMEETKDNKSLENEVATHQVGKVLATSLPDYKKWRYRILKNSHSMDINSDALEALSTDHNPLVRRAVATHPHASHTTLLKLCRDTDIHVLSALAQNPQTPVEGFDYLWTRANYDICALLAVNPSTPYHILHYIKYLPQFVEDDSFLERYEEKKYEFSLRAKKTGKPLPTPSIQLAEQYNTILSAGMVGEKDRFDYWAENDQTSSDVLVRLAKFPHATVRRKVGENLRTPVETVIVLVQEKDVFVRGGALQNPNLPVERIKSAARSAEREDPTIAFGIVANPQTPGYILRRYEKYPDPHVRARLAHNPNLPKKVWISLYYDQDPEVRTHARDNITHVPRLTK